MPYEAIRLPAFIVMSATSVQHYHRPDSHAEHMLLLQQEQVQVPVKNAADTLQCWGDYHESNSRQQSALA